jgi:hypothetical protein
MKTGTSLTLRAASLGAISFWIPDVLLHAVRRYSFDSPDLWIITIASPLVSFIACVAGARLLNVTPGAAAIRMLLGVWLFGGACMIVGASFSGGGFVGPGVRGTLLLVAVSWVPVYTWMAATYDGSLFALLIASGGLFLAWILPFSGLAPNFLSRAHKNRL